MEARAGRPKCGSHDVPVCISVSSLLMRSSHFQLRPHHCRSGLHQLSPGLSPRPWGAPHLQSGPLPPCTLPDRLWVNKERESALCPTIGIPRPTRTPRYRPAGTGVAALTRGEDSGLQPGLLRKGEVATPRAVVWGSGWEGVPTALEPQQVPRRPSGALWAVPRPATTATPATGREGPGGAHLRTEDEWGRPTCPAPLGAHCGPLLHPPLRPADTHVDGPRWMGGRVTVWRAPPTPDTRKGSPLLPEPNPVTLACGASWDAALDHLPASVSGQLSPLPTRRARGPLLFPGYASSSCPCTLMLTAGLPSRSAVGRPHRTQTPGEIGVSGNS